MSRFIALVIAALFSAAPNAGTVNTPPPTAPDERLVGRWDITITTPDGARPSWLEVESSGRNALVGRFVGIVGSARPISRVVVKGDSLRFSIPPQWEAGDGDLTVLGRLQGVRLTGRMRFPDGKTYEWTAVRAPRLERSTRPTWGAAMPLLHTNDLGGWHAVGAPNQWTVRDGVLSSPRSGANLVTDRTFSDFRVHVEFRYPKESNSGVYLRGRHEVQIQDDFGASPASDRFSGIYGFIEPSEIAAKPAGEWQVYDISLVGRLVTVVANGQMVILNREIPGITGGGLGSNEGVT